MTHLSFIETLQTNTHTDTHKHTHPTSPNFVALSYLNFVFIKPVTFKCQETANNGKKSIIVTTITNCCVIFRLKNCGFAPIFSTSISALVLWAFCMHKQHTLAVRSDIWSWFPTDVFEYPKRKGFDCYIVYYLFLILPPWPV